MPEWTKAQKDAINVRGRNVVVSAAAGSGKTAVLVERVIKLVTDEKTPVDIDKILVLTFTKSAANELKVRLTTALQDVLRADSHNENAVRQLSLMPNAKICTIDSFCNNLVRENFYELGINQNFMISSEAKDTVMQETALNTVLEEYYNADDKEFLNLAEMLAKPRNDSSMVKIIKQIHQYIYAQPFPFKWLNDVVEAYNPEHEFEETQFYAYLENEIKTLLNKALSMANEGVKLLENSDADEEVFQKYKAFIDDDISTINVLNSAFSESWDKASEIYGKLSFGRMPSSKFSNKAEFKAKRDAYKKIVTEDIKGYLGVNADVYKKDMQVIYPCLKKLAEVIERYDEELLRVKEENNSYNFADIESFALKLICTLDDDGKPQKTALAQELSQNFYEILIDEYQDTNKAQDMLFSTLSNGNNLFVVGDIKQSIYSFRLAMPEVFNEKKNSYELYNRRSKNETQNAKIILDKNFRSRNDICKYVNFLFSIYMKKDVGGIEYNREEYLNYGANYYETKVSSIQMNVIIDADKDKRLEIEAEQIAKDILKKVNKYEHIMDQGYSRRLKFGDIAILMHSLKNEVEVYNRVLNAHGIPTICQNKVELFKCNEVQILLSLLRAIDNPMQDVYLLSAMTSPFYGFSYDEIAEIRKNNRGGSLYSAVLLSENEKAKAFLDDLKSLGKTAVTMPMAAFVKHVCDVKGIYAIVNAYGMGEQRVQYINKFIDFASEFDNSDSFGLTSFMRYTEKAAESNYETEVSSEISANAVQIMSIHKAKGLEFPVVILANAAKNYNKSDERQSVICTVDGIGFKAHNEERLYDKVTLPYFATKKMVANNNMGENLRVLYVAITRAKEQFISYITLPQGSKKIFNVATTISNSAVDTYFTKKASSDSDLLIGAALLHPNGDVLRKMVDQNIKPIYAGFPLKINVYDEEDKKKEEKAPKPAKFNEKTVSEIAERLSYSYDGINLSNMPSKMTASGLDEHVLNKDFFATSRPAFMNEAKMTPAERGTAMHQFMQFCNYENARENVEAEIERLKNNNFISAQQAESLNRYQLKRFFSGNIATRMFNSLNIYREFKISTFVPVKDVFPQTESDETVLIQGIADCVFEEKDGLVLVDYKTDRVETEEELLLMYEKQVAFYKTAVSRALKKPVKETLLYSFKLGKPCYYR